MKIDIKIYYKLFYGSLNIKIEEAEEDLIVLKDSLSTLKSLLKNQKPYIDSEIGVNYTQLVKDTPSFLNGKLRDNIVHQGKVYKKEAFRFYYKKYKDCKKRYDNQKQLVTSLKNRKVTLKIYRVIIKKFNLKIAKEIIDRQYVFNMGYRLGMIKAIRTISNKPKVDWHNSNKKKARLIEKGLIPYYKKEAEDAEKEGKEYKGVEWLIKHDKENVWISYFNLFKRPYIFQLVKSNASDSIKSYLSTFKQSKEYNPKSYPLIEKK